MPLVRVDLQEGFAEDRVSVRLNGVTALESDRLSTRTQIGLAAVGEERELPAGRVELVVDVPSRNLTGRLDLTLDVDKYVGVSVEGGRISFRESNEPFGYV